MRAENLSGCLEIEMDKLVLEDVCKNYNEVSAVNLQAAENLQPLE